MEFRIVPDLRKKNANATTVRLFAKGSHLLGAGQGRRIYPQILMSSHYCLSVIAWTLSY